MCACSATRPPARGGFTLIEVLLALTLASIILASLFALFDNVSDVQRHVRESFARSRVMRTVFGVMEDDLRSIQQPEDSPVLAGVSNSGFGQDESLLSIITASTLTMHQRTPHLGLQLVEYVLRGDSGRRRLVRRERPYARINGDFEYSEVVLAQDVQDLEVGYYDEDYNEFRAEWDPSFEGNDLPLAVRVRLTLGEEDAKEVYELVVPLSSPL